MSRPSLADVASGSNVWDTTINSNNDKLTEGPFPVVEYPTVGDLPAAGLYDRCIAATTTPPELWISDGAAWRSITTRQLNGARGGPALAMQLLSGLSGASVTASGLFPAGSTNRKLALRVTTTVTGATSFDAGDLSDVDRYAAAVALAAGTTKTPANATGTIGHGAGAAGDVVLTANGSNFTGGAVRLVASYDELTAPTS
jgi:hypothetical protein